MCGGPEERGLRGGAGGVAWCRRADGVFSRAVEAVEQVD